jgi:hypothetical protein
LVDEISELEKVLEFRECMLDIYVSFKKEESSNRELGDENIAQKICEEIFNCDMNFINYQNDFAAINLLYKKLQGLGGVVVGSDEKEFRIFEVKFEGYMWRLEARELLQTLKMDLQENSGEIVNELDAGMRGGAEDGEVRNLLERCPKDLRANKTREWLYLWEKIPEAALDERLIEEKILEWCNKDLDGLSQDAAEIVRLQDFIGLSNLCVFSEKLSKQLETLTMIGRLYEGKNFEN